MHRMRPTVLRTALAVAAATAACGDFRESYALTADDLEGISIETRVTYDMRIERTHGIFNPKSTMVMKLAVKDGVVVGTVTRSAKGPRGSVERENRIRVPIGVAGKPPTGGDALWIVQDDKLVLLRAFKTGGFKAEISFTGRGADMACTIRAPYMREEGKGQIQTEDSPGGGPVTILDAVQTSTDCKVIRPPGASAK
jgi:hypothetical protein